MVQHIQQLRRRVPGRTAPLSARVPSRGASLPCGVRGAGAGWSRRCRCCQRGGGTCVMVRETGSRALRAGAGLAVSSARPAVGLLRAGAGLAWTTQSACCACAVADARVCDMSGGICCCTLSVFGILVLVTMGMMVSAGDPYVGGHHLVATAEVTSPCTHVLPRRPRACPPLGA